MRDVLLIAGRELRQRGRSKILLISTAVLSIGLLAAVVLPSLLGGDEDADEAQDVRVVATAGPLSEHRHAALTATLGPAVQIREETDRAAVEAALADDADLGVVGDELLTSRGFDAFGDSREDLAVAAALGQADVLEAAGLEAGAVADTLMAAPLTLTQISLAGEAPDPARGFVAYLAVTFLYGTFLLYGSWLINGVIEEKSSRVVEILLGAVEPRALMGGKILGLGTLGVGQLVALVTPAAIAGGVVGSDLLPPGTGGLLIAVVGWWLLGFALFSTLMAALGATVSRPEDAQAVATPATLLVVVAFIASLTALQDPDGAFAVIGSFVPLLSSLLMVIRIAIGSVAWWEIPLAVAASIIATVGMTAIAGRIYEGALLRMGSRMKLREAWRASRA